MEEHKDTIKVLRQHFTEQLTDLCCKRITLNPEFYHSVYDLKIAEVSTTLQIKALIRLVSNADDTCNFKVVKAPLGNDPYLGITYRGIFVGIEPDGYTHS